MAAAAGSGDPTGSKIQEMDIPILKGLSPVKNGNIHVMGQNIEGKGWDNVFSFIYYYKRMADNLDFNETVYYNGLLTYVQMIHGAEFSYTPSTKEGNGGVNGGKPAVEQKAKLPGKNGMIIYTNWPTLELLAREFNIEEYPNLIYAVPEWPYYSNEEHVLTSDILRTMRYHAVDLFPTLNVHMRDADTLFTAFLYSDGWDWARFQYLTTAWETSYLTNFIPEMEKSEKQIVIGASTRYSAFYHSNIPYPVEFTFPIRQPSSAEKDLNPYKHIYVRSNYYTKENQEELKKIRYEKIPEEEGESRGNYFKRENEVRRKRTANYKATIPEERRELIPYYNYFTKHQDYIYLRGSDWFGEGGVFAGFASVLKNRKGIEDFWKTCVDYLLSRYYMSVNPETGKVNLTDEAFETLSILQSTGKVIAKKTYGFGKDERMLLYGILPKYLSSIYFFDIRYFKYLKQYTDWKDKEFLEPDYPERILQHRSAGHRELLLHFKPFVKYYLQWLAEIQKKYPTQKNFLDAIEANFQKRFIPFDAVMEQTSKNQLPFEGHAEPYREFQKYGRATLPGKLEGGLRHRKTRRGRKEDLRELHFTKKTMKARKITPSKGRQFNVKWPRKSKKQRMTNKFLQ
jgi:hypothetical protein